MKKEIRYVCVVLIVFANFLALVGFAQKPVSIDSAILTKFYTINKNNLYWLADNKRIAKVAEWMSVIDSVNRENFIYNKIKTDKIRLRMPLFSQLDSSKRRLLDMEITTDVLIFLKEFQQGYIILDYDEVSVSRDSIYMNQLLKINKKKYVSRGLSLLSCEDADFLTLKKYLNDSVNKADTLRYKMVTRAMNYRKYIYFNHPSEYMVVNIPEASVSYYRKESLRLKMRAIMGRKASPTREFASYITSFVTFPYWNVPRSIAINEILPKIKKDDAYLEQNNFEVIDADGRVVESSNLEWKDFSDKYFPYHLRQSTGPDNALGVLKFELKNPYSIFLHATSNSSSFFKSNLFLSHGCIRLEKPFELASELLRGRIDIVLPEKDAKDTKPTTIVLENKIAVFIIYATVIIIDSDVVFLKDIYGKIK